MAEAKSALTDAVRAMIGVQAERVQASLWGVEREDLRRFTQAIMDPDPRYWDDEFAKSTRFGAIVTPPAYCMYLRTKTAAWEEDPITRAYREDPDTDAGVTFRGGRGALPPIPTDLKRTLNAGTEIEVYKYPALGDVIFSQGRYADIKARSGKDGSSFLIITTETVYTDQNGALLCLLRASSFLR